MNKLLVVLLLVPSIAKSEVRALNLELKRLPYVRDYFMPDAKYWDAQLNLNWNVGFGAFFWENSIDARTRHSRFRYVAWEYKTGFDLTKHVALVWHHRSEHAMDIYSYKYPVRDSYGVRINFMGGEK